MTSSPGATPVVMGRELDARVAEKVMGWTDFMPSGVGEFDVTATPREWDAVRYKRVPDYSTSIAAAFLVLERVQAMHPGWRFSLLGGDTSFAMVQVARGIEVDYGQRESFGWRASFFGHEDPAKNTGQRHADEWAETPALAICRAALLAVGAA